MSADEECWIDGAERTPPTLEAELGRRCAALRDLFDLDLAFAARAAPDGRLRLLAHACSDSAIVKEVLEADLRWRGGGALHCFTEAVRAGRPHVCRELPGCCRVHLGTRFVGGTICVVPLLGTEGLYGLLVMCTARPTPFDEAFGRAFLDELGLSFGLLAERAAAASRLSLARGALSAVADAVFVTDRDAVIEWVNDAFVALTGYSREEVVGRTPRMLQSGLHDEACYRALKSTIRAGRSWSGELTNRRKDGSLYTVHQTITPILEGNRRVRHFVAVQHDLTERVRLERGMSELKAELDLAARRERSRIAREIHDELGGALAALRHDVEWLIGRTRDGAALERLQIMLELTGHSLSTARRIASGLRPQVVDELGFVGALGWLAREFGQHHALRIELDLAPGLAEVAGAQAEETYRVVQECLNNVARHARAGEVSIRGRIDGGRLVLEVADDGTGTPPGNDASGVQGMAERAQRMGGHLEIDRERGTRVRLVVPVVRKDAPT